MALASAYHGCLYKYPKGVGYFFPTDRDVSDFVGARANPIIDLNSIIKESLTATDKVALKKIKNSTIYFRGLKSKTATKSIPVDKVIFDEEDEAHPDSIERALKRLSASTFKEAEHLSNPTIPDYGIDKRFQQSDQKHYMLKCPHCNEWNCLEDLFPNCLVERGKNDVILGCHKCGRELDKAKGQWVAKYPDIKDCSGYQYSQLFSPTVTPLEIWLEYKEALKSGRLANFMNLSLGMAYIAAQNRLTKEHVLSLSSSEFPKDFWSVSAPCYMGVDQGKDLHVVFKKEHSGKTLTLPVLEFDFEALDKYMDKVEICVIDGMPETRKAKEFALRHIGKVYLNYYSASQKGEYKWNDEEWIVQENRTESMDASHEPLYNSVVVLPPYDETVEEYAMHCNNTAKKLHEDEETGSRVYIYVKLGPDHFRHADNYATIAMSARAKMPRGYYC